MTIRKIALDKEIKENIVKIDKNSPVYHRILNVLKVDKNDDLILIDGSGFEYIAKLKEKGENLVLEVVKKVKIKNKINKFLTVYLSFIKKNQMEDLIEKLVELGVQKIVPIRTERTNWFLNEIPKRWENLVKKANEVSTWENLTKIEKPLKFIDAIMNAKNSFIILADPYGEITLKQIKKKIKKVKNISLFIGPEGGFTEKEIKLAKQNGANLVKITQNKFRTETATLIFSCLILYG
jgi:16S rRNA (uracil1498-N3)-methyltransferase